MHSYLSSITHATTPTSHILHSTHHHFHQPTPHHFSSPSSLHRSPIILSFPHSRLPLHFHLHSYFLIFTHYNTLLLHSHPSLSLPHPTQLNQINSRITLTDSSLIPPTDSLSLTNYCPSSFFTRSQTRITHITSHHSHITFTPLQQTNNNRINNVIKPNNSNIFIQVDTVNNSRPSTRRPPPTSRVSSRSVL